ncbi:Hypothetical predicted protein [Marmota monax]|uniref:Ig-like domain-containing protein n=1 Tax=Marmota monax TaxID=9995 RepID=A0A5E4CEB1_MARMO|nr:Hypothetical predicted protein [Marmota monax]
MSAESLWLLCLGLCLGLADQGENGGLHRLPDEDAVNSEFFPEKLPRPSLCAWPSSVVELGSSVTLQCRAGFQNATFMWGKLHDPGFKQEQSSAETKAEFPLASLQPEDAGGYFCAYKTAATGQWSEQSQRLQLVVTGSWPAPSLSVSADPEAAPGHRTLRCLTPNNGSECLITALLRTGTPDPVQVKEGRENQTDFTLRESSEDRGSYSCVYYQCDWPHLGSSRSSRLEMQATDETDGPGAPSTKTDLRSILAATFSCLAIVLLLICVFLVDGWTQQGELEARWQEASRHCVHPVSLSPELLGSIQGAPGHRPRGLRVITGSPGVGLHSSPHTWWILHPHFRRPGGPSRIADVRFIRVSVPGRHPSLTEPTVC